MKTSKKEKDMSFQRITQVRFTQAEFGALQSIYLNLKTAKTKKEHAKLLSAIHSYIKSLASNGILKFIPKKFSVYAIQEEVNTSDFPGDICYTIVIKEEEEDGK